MNKKQFTDAVAANMESSNADAHRAVEAVLFTIQEVLEMGESIQFTGFGTFSVKERAARKGRNPATGESIDIAAKNVVKFKVGATLADAVN